MEILDDGHAVARNDDPRIIALALGRPVSQSRQIASVGVDDLRGVMLVVNRNEHRRAPVCSEHAIGRVRDVGRAQALVTLRRGRGAPLLRPLPLLLRPPAARLARVTGDDDAVDNTHGQSVSPGGLRLGTCRFVDHEPVDQELCVSGQGGGVGRGSDGGSLRAARLPEFACIGAGHVVRHDRR